VLTTVVVFALAFASALSCVSLIAACILSGRTREELPEELEIKLWSIREVKLEPLASAAQTAGFGSFYSAGPAR
jgi:hypothetical protein